MAVFIYCVVGLGLIVGWSTGHLSMPEAFLGILATAALTVAALLYRIARKVRR